MLASSKTELIGRRREIGRPARTALPAKTSPAYARTDAGLREVRPESAAEPDTAGALHILGLVAESRGDFPVAERWYRRSLETAHAQVPQWNGDPAAMAHNARAAVVAHAALGCVLLAQGDHEGARAHLESALQGHRGTTGSRLNETHLLANLCVANLRRDVRRARRLAGEALKSGNGSGNGSGNENDLPELLAAIAVIAVHMGLDAPAGRLFGAAEAANAKAGRVFSPAAVAVHGRARDLGRLHLSRMAFDSATRTGRELSLEAAIDLAQRVITVKSNPLPCGLTRRELEVADLVGTGLTNKQIARRMVLGERTIDTHVTHIRAKLGANTREEIAAWAAHRRLHGDPDPA